MTALNTAETATELPLLDQQTKQKIQRHKAWMDVVAGFKMWKIWLALAWQDIKLRYRRSVIGPLWITLSMAITVYSMGFLYSRLFHMDLDAYFPYLVTGMLAWGLISGLINEGTETYLYSAGLIRQIKIPYTFHIHRMCMRNLIIFAHNFLVMLPIYLFFHHRYHLSSSWLTVFPNMILFYVNACLLTNLISMICARYRDLGQVIKSLLQVLFFLTPVMWEPSVLNGNHKWFVLLNPLYSFVQLIRQPLLGLTLNGVQYGVVFLITLCSAWVNYILFVRYRSRIVYWL